MDFKKFLEENKEKIDILAEKNCKKNEEGRIVLEENDDWRNESEWDEYYSEIIN